MPRLSRLLTVSAFLTTALVASPSVIAAPQALGLVATNGTIELKCSDDGCGADFTAFCLQKDRASPDRGTPYHINSGDIEVAGLTATGQTIKLDVNQALKLESRRKHMALRVQVPESTLRQHNLVSVSVNVRDNVVLLPQTQAGDANPHSPAEVAMLGQSMRQIGASYIDGNQDRIVAARILGDVINGLPERGKVDDQTRQNLWNNAVSRAGDQVPDAGLNRAEGIYKLCKWTAGRGSPNMRNCLESHHDEFIKFLNSQYWKASRPIY